MFIELLDLQFLVHVVSVHGLLSLFLAINNLSCVSYSTKSPLNLDVHATQMRSPAH